MKPRVNFEIGRKDGLLGAWRSIALVLSVLILSSCASFKGLHTKKDIAGDNVALEETLLGASLKNKVSRPAKNRNGRIVRGADIGPTISQTPSDLGYVPVLSRPSEDDGEAVSSKRPSLKVKKVDAFVAPLILPEFIDIVFGEMLKAPYVTGPKVAKRKDVVQLRSSGVMKSSNFLSLVSTALEEYGVRVVVEDGAYRILENQSLRARMPKFIKGRARLRTRSDLRPIIQFVEMQAVDAGTMAGFLTDAFGKNNDKITIQRNPTLNYVILSGLPADVDAAIGIIRQLDELRYAGSQIRRYSPRYWNVEELSKELTQALKVEGWQVSSSSARSSIIETRTIYLMPVNYSNDLFVFSNLSQAHERVSRWLKEFDRPIDGGDTEQIFIYQVKNVDASRLVDIANGAMSGQLGQNGQSQNVQSRNNSSRQSENSQASRRGAGANSRNNAGSRNSNGLSGGMSGGMFTVDTMGNRIVFSGTSADYDKMVGLLRRLDTPTPEVLLEIQIAEVTLTDNTNFGVQFFIDDLGNDNVGLTAGSKGLGLGASGLNVALLSGNVDASINAFATNRRVKILSTPIVVAKSGSAAELQVGTDVPVITSQRAANNQNGTGATDILQSIDYRSTGVLTSIEPIVFSDNRIDLTISQEVSSTIDVQNSSIASPTISNRTIHTQLSLEDGETAVLGGLIQETLIRDEKGIPLLKDIPLIGQAFSNDSHSVDRTELVMLITAYVLRGQSDKTPFVNHLSRRIDGYMSDDSRFTTLLPKHF